MAHTIDVVAICKPLNDGGVTNRFYITLLDLSKLPTEVYDRMKEPYGFSWSLTAFGDVTAGTEAFSLRSNAIVYAHIMIYRSFAVIPAQYRVVSVHTYSDDAEEQRVLRLEVVHESGTNVEYYACSQLPKAIKERINNSKNGDNYSLVLYGDVYDGSGGLAERKRQLAEALVRGSVVLNAPIWLERKYVLRTTL